MHSIFVATYLLGLVLIFQSYSHFRHVHLGVQDRGLRCLEVNQPHADLVQNEEARGPCHI